MSEPLQAVPASAAPQLKMTAKEELAVICERLKQHIKDSPDDRCKDRLDIAHDIIRGAIYFR